MALRRSGRFSVTLMIPSGVLSKRMASKFMAASLEQGKVVHLSCLRVISRAAQKGKAADTARLDDAKLPWYDTQKTQGVSPCRSFQPCFAAVPNLAARPVTNGTGCISLAVHFSPIVYTVAPRWTSASPWRCGEYW